MKKIFAIALALVMMFAVCVPAFATEINKDSVPQNATADVYTKTTTEDDQDAYTYSVIIPAEFPIAWNDTSAQDVSYEVTSQLLLGAKLKVSVEANDGGKMTNANTTQFLTFALENGGEVEFAEINNAAKPATAPTVAVADFSGVPIAEYSGTLTYTVTYVAPVVTP